MLACMHGHQRMSLKANLSRSVMDLGNLSRSVMGLGSLTAYLSSSVMDLGRLKANPNAVCYGP